jgi:CHAT domain
MFFFDVDIALNRIEGSFAELFVSARSPLGETEASAVRLEFRSLLEATDALNRKPQTLQKFRDAGGVAGRRAAPREETPWLIGEALARNIFVNTSIGAALSAAIKRTAADNTTLTIRIVMSSEEVGSLPWELILDPSLQNHLLGTQRIHLTRYVRLPIEVREIEKKERRAVLYLDASSAMPSDVLIPNELGFVRETIGASKRLHFVEIAPATWEAARTAMSNADIVHFSGHGSSSQGLLFAGLNGEPEIVSGSEFANAAIAANVLVVVLATCNRPASDSSYWAGLATQMILDGIPIVVAMQREVLDVNARNFSQTFYSALADGRTVEEAVANGRRSMSGGLRPFDWAAPVLYSRIKGEGRLFTPLTREPVPKLDRRRFPVSWFVRRLLSVPPVVAGLVVVSVVLGFAVQKARVNSSLEFTGGGSTVAESVVEIRDEFPSASQDTTNANAEEVTTTTTSIPPISRTICCTLDPIDGLKIASSSDRFVLQGTYRGLEVESGYLPDRSPESAAGILLNVNPVIARKALFIRKSVFVGGSEQWIWVFTTSAKGRSQYLRLTMGPLRCNGVGYLLMRFNTEERRLVESSLKQLSVGFKMDKCL